MTTTRKPAEKSAAPKAAKINLATLEVGASEIANCIGVTTGNITGLKQTGTITPNSRGKYLLQPTICAYCRSLRERKAGDGKSELELEHIALKNEKLRQQLATWRTQRDREVALAILNALRNAMGRLRDECRLVPALTETIDAMLGEIDRVDVDGISYIVEGGEDDDEE